MAKLTLNSIANLTNENTTVASINTNNASTVAALENTLSRDGTGPNEMHAGLDMNSFPIINLPTPALANDPVRLIDLQNAVFDGMVPSVTEDALFVYKGDSRTNTADKGTWPTQLASLNSFFDRTPYVFAVNGQAASTMVSELSGQLSSVPFSLGSNTDAYFFLWAGARDLQVSVSAATIYGYLTSMWATARTAGYKVVAFTMIGDATLDATQNATRLALNALIVSDRTVYDYLVRVDGLLPNNLDTYIFNADNIHLILAGNVLIAQEVIATLLDVKPVYATPSDTVTGGLQVNGAVDVSAELGTTAKTGVSSTSYVCDGSWTVKSSGTPVITHQVVADAPSGFTNSVKVTVTTAVASPAAGDYVYIEVPVEGYRARGLAWGSYQAQPLSVCFWTKRHRVGTYSGAISNGQTDRSYPFSYTQDTADTWEFKTVTLPGCIDGVWIKDNNKGLRLWIAMGSGTTFYGTAGTWSNAALIGVTGSTNGIAATSDTLQLTGVFIVPGLVLPSSQKLPLIMRPYDQEIELCRRHFYLMGEEAISRAPIAPGYVLDATNYVASINFPRKLLKVPTLYLSSASHFECTAAGNVTIPSVIAIASPTTSSAGLLATVSGATAGQGGILRVGLNMTSARLGFDSRLSG